MHFRSLPETAKNFGGIKYGINGKKFSNGKYENKGELFAENISESDVKLMGEMIALQSLRTVKRYDLKVADKSYIGLIKDFHHMNEVDIPYRKDTTARRLRSAFFGNLQKKASTTITEKVRK